MSSDEARPAAARMPADLTGRGPGMTLAGLIDVLDRADGPSGARRPRPGAYRTTAARAGSLRGVPLRPVRPAPAARPAPIGSVSPSTPVWSAPVRSAAPAPTVRHPGFLTGLVRRLALWGAGPDGEYLAWRCAAPRPATRPEASAGVHPGARPAAIPTARTGLLRRLALWGAGDQGEYLAWGRPAVRLTAAQANPPVVLREMPSTPTIRPAAPGHGAFPRRGRSADAARCDAGLGGRPAELAVRAYGDRVFTTRPELAGTFGMVASTHWLASAAGMATLEAGGNAFDAAVAAGFTLQVVEPHLNGPGGEVPILFATGERSGAGRGGPCGAVVLSGQGVAPAAATIEAFEQYGLDLVPGTGLLAATVPGAFGAWLTLLRDHGTQPLDAVLRYAIEYAETGHPLLPRVTATVASVSELFATHWPTSATTWLSPDGAPPAAGRLFRNPVLASTFRRLLDAARGPSREAQIDAAMSAWYSGFVAEEIDRFARYPVMDDSGRPHPGFLTGQDLAGWTPTYEAPVTLDRNGWTLAKAGPWSQGPALLQAIAMLDDVDAGRHRERSASGISDADTAEAVHVSVEATKLAMADREAWYGDVQNVPVDDLLSSAYATERRALIGDTASTALRPGSPGGRPPRLPAFLTTGAARAGRTAGAGLGEPTVDPLGTTRGDTCHIDVVDRWGNLVSATPSGGWLQSSPVIPALGFPLGTRAQMFWLERGLANSLAPGKRPRTTLTPSLALRSGVPSLAFGTPGGDQQEQWQLCFWLAHVHRGLDLQAAIDAPAWHTTAFPSSFYPRESTVAEVVVESRLGDAVIGDLRRRGHDVTVAGAWTLGRLSAVSRDPETGILRAAANARGMQGYAAGR